MAITRTCTPRTAFSCSNSRKNSCELFAVLQAESDKQKAKKQGTVADRPKTHQRKRLVGIVEQQVSHAIRSIGYRNLGTGWRRFLVVCIVQIAEKRRAQCKHHAVTVDPPAFTENHNVATHAVRLVEKGINSRIVECEKKEPGETNHQQLATHPTAGLRHQKCAQGLRSWEIGKNSGVSAKYATCSHHLP